MIKTVEIVEGHFQGSDSVVVSCDEADNTTIVLYKYSNNVQTLVGSDTLGNDAELGSGYARITLDVNLSIGDILQGSVVEFGAQSGIPVIVYEEVNGIKTGFRDPYIVLSDNNELNYNDYLAAGGQEIASIYAPEESINNTVNRNNSSPKQFIDCILSIKYTTTVVGSTTTNCAVVSLQGFNNAIGNPRVKFDTGSFAQVYSKTYFLADNGSHTVTIKPESLEYQQKTISFNISVVNTGEAPGVADIWNAGYEINPESNRQVSIIAHSRRTLEARIVELDGGAWKPMTGFTGGKWGMTPYLNVPNGTYTGQARVVGTAAVYPITIIVDF